ncbi:MAG: DUF6748 domain-containing protein [Myxococcaceae bacterium]
MRSLGVAVLLFAVGCQRHTDEAAARDDAGGPAVESSHVHTATPVEDAGVVLSARNQGAMMAPGADAGEGHPMVPHGDAGAEAGNPGSGLVPPAGKSGGDAGMGSAETAQKAHLYVVRDSKLRCIVAPCMSLEVMPVDSSEPTQKVSDLDFTAAKISDDERAAAMARVNSKAGLKVAGTVVDGPKGRGGVARVMKVEQVFAK